MQMNIKEIRAQCGMTQAQLSERLGIPKRTIEDWERGARKPPEYIINLIKKVLLPE